jgi:hypothetical protein
MRTDDAQYLQLIPSAQRCDQSARAKLVMFLDERYGWMLAKLYSGDPMLSREDIHSEFLEGIIGGIPKVKMEVGDPLFHLAQRGLWKAKAAVESARRYQKLERHGNYYDEDGLSVEDVWTDRTQQDPADIVVQRNFARHVTKVISMAGLGENERRGLVLILSGELGDPCEMGWNKRLADALKVSAQRASQITAKLQYVFHQHETLNAHGGGWAVR